MHRVGQFVSHLTARVTPDDAVTAHQMLPGSAWGLFDGMPVADRRHGLDVAERLLAQGVDDGDVLAAALLHDAAKGHRLRLWHRVGGVLMARLAPRILDRLASPDPATTGYPWWVFIHHASLSADAALGAGLNERAAAFIRGSTRPEDQALALVLNAADEAS